MTYGTIKVDTVTFTNAGVDKSVTLSGLVQNPVFSGNVTVTGTLSGVTVTGATANFTSGNFTNISGGTHTITSGVFAAGSAASPSITFTGDLNTGIYSPGADQVAISTGGSGRLFVDANGNVGIAGSPANYVGYPNLRLNGTSGGILDFSTNGTSVFRLTGDTGGAFYYTQNTSYPHVWGQASSERMRLTSTGLGVGTSSPGKTLDVNGESRCTVAATINNGAAWYTAGDPGGYLYLGNAIGTPASIESYTPSSRSSAAQLELRFKTVNTGGSAVTAMTIDSSQRVGVGTTSPSAQLHVQNSGGNSESILGQFGTGTQIKLGAYANEAIIYAANNASAALSFYTNSSERMRIDSSGRVGIGTSSPGNAKLYVLGDTTNYGIQTEAPSGYGLLTFKQTSGNAISLGMISNGLFFYDNNAGLTRLTLDSSGRVGIGTTSPASRLHLDQGTNDENSFTIRNEEVGANFGAFGTGSAYARQFVINATRIDGGSFPYLRIGGQEGIIFAADLNSERARIDSSGRLLVGTSTSASAGGGTNIQQIFSSTNDRPLGLHFGGASSTGPYITLSKSRNTGYGSYTIVNNGDVLGGLIFAGDDGTDYQTPGAYIEAYVDGTPGANDLPTRLVFSTTADGASSPTERLRITNGGIPYFLSTLDGPTVSTTAAAGTSEVLYLGRHSATAGVVGSGTLAFRVYTNGNVQNTNNSYGAISDIKLKENVVDAGSQWDDIKALQVRNYNLKEGQTHRQIGLIAQEVEPISPGLVYESPDRDADGNDLGTVTKSVNYSVLYMKAVKALQEAMERIEVLEQRLTDAGIA